MRWFNNKSFVVKMVDSEDINETETVSIDVEKTVDTALKAGLLLMAAYFLGSTARHLVVGIGQSAGHVDPARIVNTVSPTISPVFNNDNSSVVNMGGHIVKIVERMSDGKIIKGVGKAALEAGVDRTVMSKHLNHYPGYDSINGAIYSIIGAGTTG